MAGGFGGTPPVFAAPESGGRQPQQSSRSQQPLLCALIRHDRDDPLISSWRGFFHCRVISALSHLVGSQRGFFVPGEPRTGDTRRNPRDDRKEKLRTEYLKVQFRHFLIELFRQQEDIDLVSLSFLPISQELQRRPQHGTLLHPRKTVVNLVLQWVGSGSPEYVKDSNKWDQTKMCTICHPVAWNTGDITNELRDHTSRYTTTGPLPCKVHVELVD